MPKPKRRKFEIRQERKRRKKRRRYLVPSEEIQKTDKLYANLTTPTLRTLSDVNKEHGTDFKKEINLLKQRFSGQEIEVLSEGCGLSTFAEELTEGGVKITRTDAQENVNEKYAKRHPSSKLAPIVNLPVVNLRKLGRNRFHLIESTIGGVSYTSFKPYALSNLYYVLKPGGKAFITAILFPKDITKLLEKMKIRYRYIKGKGIIIFK